MSKEEQSKTFAIDVDVEHIERQSQIYDTSKLSPSHKMYQYFNEINKAALKIAIDNPQLLQGKGKLQEAAKEYLHSRGYTYKKKNSRSKQFGVVSENKRPYVNYALKVKKIKEIQEDMSDTEYPNGITYVTMREVCQCQTVRASCNYSRTTFTTT